MSNIEMKKLFIVSVPAITTYGPLEIEAATTDPAYQHNLHRLLCITVDADFVGIIQLLCNPDGCNPVGNLKLGFW